MWPNCIRALPHTVSPMRALQSNERTPLKPHKALTPGRVPQVRQSVPGPDTIFFECFYAICDGVIGEVRALEGLRPSCSTHVHSGKHGGTRPAVKVLCGPLGFRFSPI